MLRRIHRYRLDNEKLNISIDVTSRISLEIYTFYILFLLSHKINQQKVTYEIMGYRIGQKLQIILQ